MSGLPKGWTLVPLKSCADVNMGQSPKGIYVNAEGNGMPFYQGKAEFGKLYPTPRKYCEQPTKIAQENDILLSVRAPVGPTNLCPEESCIGRGLAGIRALEPTHQPYLLKYFQHIESWLSQQGTGSTFKAISGAFLKDIDVLIAPLNEQIRIAKKLDSLFVKVDAAQTRLEKIPTLLKRFRQAVLTAATSGELTREWRGGSEGVEINLKYRAPSSWKLLKFYELTSLVTSGSRGWAKYYSDKGAIFIRAQNINTDNLNLDDVAFVDLPEKSEGKRTSVGRNDLLITITGANVTKSALVKDDFDEAYVSQHVALVKLKDKSISLYVDLFLRAENSGRGQLKELAYGAGKPGLNLPNIKNLDIALPEFEEQQEIVSRVESLFTLADTVEKQYQAAKQRLDRLSHSILAKAFRGELVAQDPNDEPASELLKRIQAERAAQKPLKKTGKRRVKRT